MGVVLAGLARLTLAPFVGAIVGAGIVGAASQIAFLFLGSSIASWRPAATLGAAAIGAVSAVVWSISDTWEAARSVRAGDTSKRR